MPIVGSGPKSNVQDFMPFLVIIKFDEDSIKKKSQLALEIFLFESVDESICPKIELVQDFIAVLITCKSDEDSIKTEIAILRITFS